MDREELDRLERQAIIDEENRIKAAKAERAKIEADKKVVVAQKKEVIGEDPKEMMKAAIPEFIIKAIQLGRETDNLTQVLATLKLLHENVYGKPEVAMKMEVNNITQDRELSEIAALIAFQIRKDKEIGVKVIEGAAAEII